MTLKKSLSRFLCSLSRKPKFFSNIAGIENEMADILGSETKFIGPEIYFGLSYRPVE